MNEIKDTLGRLKIYKTVNAQLLSANEKHTRAQHFVDN